MCLHHSGTNIKLMTRGKITHERRHIRQRLEILDRLLNSNERRTYAQLRSMLNRELEIAGEIPVSERTLKYDIAHLENNENAPIHRPTKTNPTVFYTEPYSYKTGLIDVDEISILKGAVTILKRATSIKLTDEVDEIISRLENKIHTNVPDRNTMIAFEEHTEAKGKEYFDGLFSAIREKSPIKITYQPFGKEEREWVVHPYMLKQYRSRWFLICRVGQNTSLSNIRLDSIKGKIRNSAESFIENNLFDPDTYFNNVIGVTIPKDEEPMEIVIKVAASSADYIRTKPIHKSQVITRCYKNGSMLIEMRVLNNYELKSQLLSFGPAIEVIKPLNLRKEMKNLYKSGVKNYS